MNMRHILAVAVTLLVLPGFLNAQVFFLKDGVRIEGKILGRSDGNILLETKYGNLTIKESDIAKMGVDSDTAALELSKENPGIEVINSKDLQKQEGSYVFSTVVADDGSAKIFYFRDVEIIATETLDKDGKLVSVKGNIPDRVFTEYYENGKVKAVKPMKGGRPDGIVYSYYTDGKVEIKASYKNGLKNGTVTFYFANGKPMVEAVYKDDMLEGPKKDYNAEGMVDKITWYKQDQIVDAPESTASSVSENPSEQNQEVPNANIATVSAENDLNTVESPATSVSSIPTEDVGKSEEKVSNVISMSVKARKVARGTMYSFYLNNRYRGKTRIDNEYNVIMIDGKIPDGIARLYGKNDILQLEFIFRKGEINTIIVFDVEGKESARYSINEKGIASKAI